jgi:hypothetical protein
VLAPDREEVVVLLPDRIARSPEGQQRADDATPGIAIRTVVLEIDRRGGAVVLAPAAHDLGIARGGEIRREGLLRDGARARSAAGCICMNCSIAPDSSASGSGACWIRKNQCQ